MSNTAPIRRGLSIYPNQPPNGQFWWDINVWGVPHKASGAHPQKWKQAILLREYGISAPKTISKGCIPYETAVAESAKAYEELISYLDKVAELEGRGMRLDYGVHTGWTRVFTPAAD